MWMTEFTGTYHATIDDKGRIVLPAAFKKEMGELALEPLVIERNLFKDCLDVYPEQFWKERVEAFKSTLDPFDEEDDGFLQFFYENFIKVGMAANGRINIPGDYLSYGKLSKNVRVIGMGQSVRIWDMDVYETQRMDKSTFARRFAEKRKQKSNG
jgi:MraZ protein